MKKFSSELLHGIVDPKDRQIIISTIMRAIRSSAYDNMRPKFSEMVDKPDYLDPYISKHLKYDSIYEVQRFSFGNFLAELGFKECAGWSNDLSLKNL